MGAERVHRPADSLTGPLRGTSLEKSVLSSLETLEQALQLEPVGDNRFRATNERNRFGRIFGGQLLAQAIYAASATVEDHMPHSLHAYFVQTGDSDVPVDIRVEHVRDGRSMATRQVSVAQGPSAPCCSRHSRRSTRTWPNRSSPSGRRTVPAT